MRKKNQEETPVAVSPDKGADQRKGRRAPVSVELKVQGRSDAYAGQTVDISRTGALLWITDESFLPPEAVADMVRFSERVAAELGDSMTIQFAGGVVHREAEVVRVTRKGPDDKGPMLLACRFSDSIPDEEWGAMGLDPAQGAVGESAVSITELLTNSTEGPPEGVEDRRAFPRVDRILYVEIQGDHGVYKAQALNVSGNGVLITITDPQFAPPVEPDQLVRFTKRMGFQFRSGMIIRFLESNVSIDGDVVRVSERIESGELLIVIGVKFRRSLSRDECRRLEVQAEENAPAVAPAPAAMPPVDAAPLETVTDIHLLMRQAVQLQASDIHIKADTPPRVRLAGKLMDMSRGAVSPETAHAMALELMSPALAEHFHEENDVEFAYNLPNVGRFRCAVFRQRGTTCLAMRLIPDHVPSFEELGLPPVASVLAEKPRGLVLVTGPTGSGKSHTLAAMVNHVNQTRQCHILTMEDPIEFSYDDAMAHISQREIGRDCNDFARALKRALRQDPDVILVGEIRDLESMSLALTAAETGHLVFTTLHTTSAVQAPDRIIDVFPPNQQSQVRQQLADSLQGVMAQILVPSVDDQLVLAQEIVVANDAVRALIREGKTPQVRNILQTGSREGMRTLESSLNELIRAGVISYDVAVAKANFPRSIERPGRRSKPSSGKPS